MHCVTIERGVNDLACRLWAALQQLDHSLSDLATEGVGEARGHHLIVKWGRSTSQAFFVCEVVDAQKGEVWEVGVAAIGGEQPMAFWRRTLGSSDTVPAPWTHATEACHVKPFAPRAAPTFLTMLSAYLAGGPPILVEERARQALLEDDIAYWRDLAMSQARLVRRTSAEAAERLRQAMERQGVSSAVEMPAEAPRIWTLRDMDEWAALNSERVVILPRAIAAAKRSNYFEPQNVYAGLELLAGTYRAVKRGEADRGTLKREAETLGFTLGGSVDPSVAGEAGDQYFIRWRGRRRFLDQHMRKGTSRDPRYTMRIYWTWDDDEEICIVGSLPAHLTTSWT